MSTYFLDSSALVKRYIPETGSGWILSLASLKANNRFLIAQITPVEVISAVSRRQREGIVSPRTAKAIRLLLNRHVSREYHLTRMITDVTQRAMDLLETYPMRGYDAIQLASALYIQNIVKSGGVSITFLSADTRLLSAAIQEGLAVDNPNNH